MSVVLPVLRRGGPADPSVLGSLAAAAAALVLLSRWPALPAVGPAAAFLAMWTVMVVAMMLPTALPLVRGSGWGAPAAVAGYVGVWVGAGVVVLAVRSVLPAGTPPAGGMAGMAGMAAAGPSPGVLGLGLGLAAAHLLSPWAREATRACHGPARPGPPIAAGARHGVDCVRATGALMGVMVVVGMDRLGLLVALAVVMALQKTDRWGQRVRVGAGLGLAAGAVVLAVRWAGTLGA